MSKGVGEIIAGAALIAADVAFLGANPLLLGMGASLIMGGVGTLLTKQQQGLAFQTMNPIQPRNAVYGQAKVGGTTIYQENTGQSDKYEHYVFVLADHASNSIDAVLFDGKRVCLDTSGNSLSFGGSTSVQANQQTVNIASITRANNVVTVVMQSAMPLPASTAAGPALQTGDTVQIQNVSIDNSLNGQYVIQMQPGSTTTFTYICGGNPTTQTNTGQVKTQWPDYGDTVHVETALGTQTSNPFPGLVASGDSGSNGLWTAAHTVEGCTAVYLRLKYGGNTYASGIPNIAFIVSGKNDIYDPRTGGRGYTTNSALCCADYLCHPVWGFKLSYGTDVPNGPLTAAANICDETVTLANGATEKRYTCNGTFSQSAKRDEILSNLLTSCAGRLTWTAGQYIINPAAWIGTTAIAGIAVTNASGSPATAATLTVISSHIPGSPNAAACFAQNPAVNNIGVLEPRFWMYPNAPDSSAWTNRTDTMSIPVDQLGGLSMAFGSGPPNGTDTVSDQLLIYDCYVTVTFADATTGTYRPTSAVFNTSLTDPSSPGSGTNAANAIDTDPTTAATISADTWGTVYFSPILILSSFAYPGITPTSTALTFPQFAAGPVTWRPKVPIDQLYNGVKATYVCPANNWQPADMPPYMQDTNHGYTNPGGSGYYDINLTADGGDRRWLELQFPFTNSAATAQRLAKIELLRRRQQGSGTFLYNLAMLQLTSLDIIEMNFALFGWTDKLLEVTNLRFKAQKQDQGNAIALGTELDLQETDPSVYSWSSAEELTAEGYSQPSMLPAVQTIATPTSVTATNSTVAGSGVTQGQLKITWDAPTDGFIVNGGYSLVQYSLDDSTWIALGTFDSSVTSAFIPNVAAGQSYWVRVAWVNTAGIQSAWTVYGPITATGSSMRRIDDETPTGTIDGSNTAFTLTQTPNPATSLALYVNGDLQLQGLDYTVSGTAITMTTAPKTGWWVRAFYWY